MDGRSDGAIRHTKTSTQFGIANARQVAGEAATQRIEKRRSAAGRILRPQSRQNFIEHRRSPTPLEKCLGSGPIDRFVLVPILSGFEIYGDNGGVAAPLLRSTFV